MRIDISRLAGIFLLAGISLVIFSGIALGQEAAPPAPGAAGEAPWCPPPAPEAAPGVEWCPPPAPQAAAPDVEWCPPPAPEAAPGVEWCPPPPAQPPGPPCPVCPPVPGEGAAAADMAAPQTGQDMAVKERTTEEMVMGPEFEEGMLPQAGTSMGPGAFGQHWGPYPDDVAVQLVGPTGYQGPAYGPYGEYYGRRWEWYPAGVPAYVYDERRFAQAMEAPQAGAIEDSPYEEMPLTLSMDDARTVMQNYLAQKNQPGITLGNVTDMGDHYEGLLLDAQGCAVERVIVDKCKSVQSLMNPQTGIPEPAMKTSDIAVCLNAADARQIMTNFLATKDPNLTLGEVQDMGTYFQAPVLSAEGCAVQKLAVCKSMGIRTEKPDYLPDAPQAGQPAGAGPAPGMECPPSGVAPDSSGAGMQSPQAGAGAEGALTEDRASAILGNYIQAKDPNLKLGTIEDRGGFFEAPLLDQQNNMVETVRIDKNPPHMISSFEAGEAPQAGPSESRQFDSAPQTGAPSASTPLSETDARAILQNYANAQGNNMQLGTVEEADGFFTATIVDENGRIAQTVQLDKNTCLISPVR